MIEVCFCEKAHFYFTPPPPSQSKFLFFWVGDLGMVGGIGIFVVIFLFQIGY